jgi:hypothetical protein
MHRARLWLELLLLGIASSIIQQYGQQRPILGTGNNSEIYIDLKEANVVGSSENRALPVPPGLLPQKVVILTGGERWFLYRKPQNKNYV